MNQKKNASASQEDLSSLSVRRRQEILDERENRKKTRIYAIVAIVVAILVAALLIWDSGLIQRNATAYKVDDYSFSVADANYYFYSQYNSYAPYGVNYGLDTSVSLKEQEFAEGQTWYDFLLESAESEMREVAFLCSQAKANGYQLSDEGKASVDSAVQSVKDVAAQSGVSASTYLNYAYGRYMTLSAYKSAVTDQVLAQEYSNYITDSYEITDEELNTYYQENSLSFDDFDYEAYVIYLGLAAEHDEEGNPLDFDPDELAAAQAELQSRAEQLKTVMETGTDEEIAAAVSEVGAGDMSGLPSSSLSYYSFGQWLADNARTSGEVGIVDQTNTDSSGEEYVSAVYVVRYNGRSLDEYYAANFYDLLIQADAIASEDTEAETQYDWETAKTEIDALQADWLANGGDADSFLAIAEENTDGSTTEYTHVAKGAQNTEVDEWLFGTEHQSGDYAVIEDSALHGYRLVYFTGYDEQLYWQYVASNAISSQRYNDWVSAAEETQVTTATSFISYVG